MKKIIVFGSSGFLGSYVVEELLSNGYKVVGCDIKKPENFPGNFKYVECNILDKAKTMNTVSEDCEAVFNFAGVAALDYAVDNPVETVNTNILGNLHLLEACRAKNINKYIYASSAYAVSDAGSFYGISKHTCEKLIEEYNKKYGLNFIIIRYGSLYGERADSDNYIYNVLKSALKNKIIEYKGSGNDLREYIHAKDAAELTIRLLNDEEFLNQHIILTGVEKHRRIELLEMIKEMLGGDVELICKNPDYQGHYSITPYSFQPSMAKKLAANPYIDLGQGLIECMKKISAELEEEN